VPLTPTPERRHAALALHWLIEDRADDPGFALDWGMLQSLAQSNAILVKLDDLLGRTGMRRPSAFVDVAAAARARAAAALAVVVKLRDACARQHVECVFPSLVDHFPDVGNDIDLLVLSRTAEVDAALLAAVPATPDAMALWDRIAGASVYQVSGSDLMLDIHHGRLGIIGEHTEYPRRVVRQRQLVSLDGAAVPVPAPEDRLILQGMNRVYGRRHFRLGDVLATVRLIRTPGLDWADLVATARALGALSGLSCYLGYVDRIYREAYGAPLIPDASRAHFTLDGWGEPVFHDRGYRFPALRVGRRLFWSEFGSVLGAGEWSTVSRLCLVPPLVAAAGVRKLARRRWFRAPEPRIA
jgi:hypothetical protein